MCCSCFKKFPKRGNRERERERGGTTFVLQNVSLSTTGNFQLRVSFSRSILAHGIIPPTKPCPPRCILRGQRIPLSLSLSRSRDDEIHGDIFRACFHGWLEIGNTWLRLSIDFHGFCLLRVRIHCRNLHLSERISFFLTTSVGDSIAPTPLITIKNVVHRVEERLSTSLGGLYI